MSGQRPEPKPERKPAARPGAMPASVVWTRRVLVAAGSAALLYAVIELPRNLTIPREQRDYLRFLILVTVVGLAVVLPAVLGIGRLLRRTVPGPYRAVLQGALFVSLMLVVVALPALVGAGRAADLPSALPRDYVGGLAVALGAVWAVALLVAVAHIARRGSGRGKKVDSP